ncbi:MAG: electron transfer flavoprotein subunit alpha/FixB family protein [Chloroflexi bacterium]|nr:electron transfer flavoprotein subunit alpha/FixB family protein [Chloroflexota bacterium]
MEALVAGAPSAGLAGVAESLGAHGVAAVHLVEDARLDTFAPQALGAVVAQVVGARSPGVVLGPGTERGSEVIAHAAARLGQPMAANVISMSQDGGAWRLSRQRWAGSLVEDATLEAPVAIATVAPHTTAASEVAGAAAPTVAPFAATLTARDLRVRVTGREPAAEGSISLSDAKVVVGGGRGVGSADSFADLDELAGLLGAAVGVSRVVTSNGWKPHTMQIGQTGQRIAPDLYIACGISGAIQHIVGCKAAKRILAINTDPEAPILGRATYAVIGDLHQVVPAISAEIRRRA